MNAAELFAWRKALLPPESDLTDREIVLLIAMEDRVRKHQDAALSEPAGSQVRFGFDSMVGAAQGMLTATKMILGIGDHLSPAEVPK